MEQKAFDILHYDISKLPMFSNKTYQKKLCKEEETRFGRQKNGVVVSARCEAVQQKGNHETGGH